MKPASPETAPVAPLESAQAAPAAKVADKTWQRRVLLFDGLLIGLLGWLLWTLYTDRSAATVPEKTQLEVDAPSITPGAVESGLPAGNAPVTSQGTGPESEPDTE